LLKGGNEISRRGKERGEQRETLTIALGSGLSSFLIGVTGCELISMSNSERKVGREEEERGEGDGDNLKQERFRNKVVSSCPSSC